MLERTYGARSRGLISWRSGGMVASLFLRNGYESSHLDAVFPTEQKTPLTPSAYFLGDSLMFWPAGAVRVLRPGGRLMIADLWSTRLYSGHLTKLGLSDVTRRSLGWRMWW